VDKEKGRTPKEVDSNLYIQTKYGTEPKNYDEEFALAIDGAVGITWKAERLGELFRGNPHDPGMSEWISVGREMWSILRKVTGGDDPTTDPVNQLANMAKYRKERDHAIQAHNLKGDQIHKFYRITSAAQTLRKSELRESRTAA